MFVVLEALAHLGYGMWTGITNLPPAAADGPVTVCDPLGETNRFYRLGEL